MKEPGKSLWGGRFEGAMSVPMEALNRSLDDDFRLWPYDIKGSRAWAGALGAADVLSDPVVASILEGLDVVETALRGLRAEDLDDEDVHTLVERLLTEAIGTDAGRLHTGRSRNDQVATDLRLWGLDLLARLDGRVTELAGALVHLAEGSVDVIMPGYTHLQQAQPIRGAHWCLSHVWPLFRDRDRIRSVRASASTLPLGSGAIAGCPFPIDRERLRAELGFDRISENSLDATSDRDWALDLLFSCAMIGSHLSRLAEDLVLFCTREFGFISLDDAFTTGSSLMPQKRNPDVAELTRGSAALLIGDLVAMLTMVKGLPTGYDRDLQHDKAAVFRATDMLETVLPAIGGAISTAVFNEDAATIALSPDLLATDVADLLVAEGVPFRESHELVGRLFLLAEREGIPADELPIDTRAAVHSALADWTVGPDAYAASTDRRAAAGGTARSAVVQQLEAARKRLAD